MAGESREPSEEIVQAVESSHAWRGAIVNSYAQIEFLLADLVSRCRMFPQYDAATARLPFGANQRVKAVKKLCELSGPLQPYTTDLVLIAEKLLEFEELRHFLTHGFCTCLFTPRGEIALRFQRFDPAKKDEWAQKIREIRLEELHHLKLQSTTFAQTSVMLFRQIHVDLGWEATGR